LATLDEKLVVLRLFLRLASLNCSSQDSMGMIRLGAIDEYETPRRALRRNSDQARVLRREELSGIIGPHSTIKTRIHTKFASEKRELERKKPPPGDCDYNYTHTLNIGGTVFPTLCITRRSDWTQKG
jgi:hypothetical protein